MFLRALYRKLVSTEYNIGFVSVPSGAKQYILQSLDIKWLKRDNCSECWYADPFILSVDDNNVYLLVEEWVYSKNKGRISKLTVEKGSFRLIRSVPILDLDTHLSFPAILRVDGDIYIYPENYQSGKLSIYKYDSKNETVDKCGVLVNLPLTDASIDCCDFLKENYIFSTDISCPNGNNLGIYKSDSVLGKYKKVAVHSFSEKVARNAGGFFRIGDDVFRPAQICNKRYGEGLEIQMVKYEDGTFSFVPVKRYYPKSKIWNLGIHTFNVLDDIIVVDGNKFRSPYIGRLLNFLRIPQLLIVLKLKLCGDKS